MNPDAVKNYFQTHCKQNVPSFAQSATPKPSSNTARLLANPSFSTPYSSCPRFERSSNIRTGLNPSFLLPSNSQSYSFRKPANCDTNSSNENGNCSGQVGDGTRAPLIQQPPPLSRNPMGSTAVSGSQNIPPRSNDGGGSDGTVKPAAEKRFQPALKTTKISPNPTARPTATAVTPKVPPAIQVSKSVPTVKVPSSSAGCNGLGGIVASQQPTRMPFTVQSQRFSPSATQGSNIRTQSFEVKLEAEETAVDLVSPIGRRSGNMRSLISPPAPFQVGPYVDTELLTDGMRADGDVQTVGLMENDQELDNLRVENAALRRNVEAVNEKFVEAEKEMGMLREIIADMNERDLECHQIQEKVNAWRRKLAENEAEKLSIEKRFRTNLTEKTEAYKLNVSQMKEKLCFLENEKKKGEERINTMECRILGQMGQIRDFERQLAESQHQYAEDLSACRVKYEQNITQLECQLTDAVCVAGPRVKMTHEKSLQATIAKYESHIRHYRAALDSVSDQFVPEVGAGLSEHGCPSESGGLDDDFFMECLEAGPLAGLTSSSGGGGKSIEGGNGMAKNEPEASGSFVKAKELLRGTPTKRRKTSIEGGGKREGAGSKFMKKG